MYAGKLQTTSLHLIQHHPQKLQNKSGNEENDQNNRQPRQSRDNRQGNLLHHAKRPVSQRRAPHPRPRKQTECPAQPDVKANQTQQEHQQGVKPNLNGANVPPPALRHPAAILHNTQTVDASKPAPGSPGAIAEQQKRQQASGSFYRRQRQPAGIVLIAQRHSLRFHARQHALRGLIEGQIVPFVQIPFRQQHHGLTVHHDQPPLLVIAGHGDDSERLTHVRLGKIAQGVADA